MEFSSFVVASSRILIISSFFSSLGWASDFPFEGKPFQVELIAGYNHSYSPDSKMYVKSYTPDVPTEIDQLHDTSDGNSFIGGGGVSYVFPIPDANHIISDMLVGLDLLFFNTTRSGPLYLQENPAFDNYHYDMKLDTSRLMLNGELDFYSPWKNILPYFQVSVGVARVDAQFNTNDNIGNSFDLQEETNYNFAWSVGGGVKYLFQENFQLSLSYLFTDFGHVDSSTKNTAGDEALTMPISDGLRTSSVLVGLSYLFG